MTEAAFLSAVLILLLAPGPTNTLIGLAGARQGRLALVRLIPAELSGYLLSVLPLAWLGSEVLDRFPLLAGGLKLAAALWVMVLAIRLWQAGMPDGPEVVITPQRVFVTTLLNPKALIFGLVLLPQPGAADFLPKLGLFCLCVMGVACLWGSAGSMVKSAGKAGSSRFTLLQRLASLWLAVVSLSLIAGLVQA